MDCRIDSRINLFKKINLKRSCDYIAGLRKNNMNNHINEKRFQEANVHTLECQINDIDIKLLTTNDNYSQKLLTICKKLNEALNINEQIGFLKLLKLISCSEKFFIQAESQINELKLVSLLSGAFLQYDNDEILYELIWILANFCYYDKYCLEIYECKIIQKIFNLLSLENVKIFEILISFLSNFVTTKNLLKNEEIEKICNLILKSELAYTIVDDEVWGYISLIFKNNLQKLSIEVKKEITIYECQKLSLSLDELTPHTIKNCLSILEELIKEPGTNENIIKNRNKLPFIQFLSYTDDSIKESSLKILLELTIEKEIAKFYVNENIISVLIGLIKLFYNKSFVIKCIALLCNCVVHDYSIKQLIEEGIIELIGNNFIENDNLIKVQCIYLIQAILENLTNRSIIENLVEKEFFKVIFEFFQLRCEEFGYSIIYILESFLNKINEDALKSFLLDHFEKIELIHTLNEKFNSSKNETYLSFIENFLSKFYHYNVTLFSYDVKEFSPRKLENKKQLTTTFKIAD